MPRLCNICQCQIPTSTWVDGVEKITGTRVHCYECVPFGTRLKPTGKKGRRRKHAGQRTCKECGKTFNQSGRNLTCSSCKGRARREQNKRRAIEYLGGKCSKCGYDRYFGALEFHHQDASKKEFALSRHWQRGWDQLRPELDKCELLCANCHREEHAGI